MKITLTIFAVLALFSMGCMLVSVFWDTMAPMPYGIGAMVIGAGTLIMGVVIEMWRDEQEHS